MPIYIYVLQFVSGLFLANGVPHFVQGISGHRFQSPFASPPGVGESSPIVNVLWGFANLAVGFAVLWSVARQSGWECGDDRKCHFGGRGGMMLVAARQQTQAIFC